MTPSAHLGRPDTGELALPVHAVANSTSGAGIGLFDGFTERAKQVISHAHREAYRFVPDYIGTEHLLLGLISDGAIAEILCAVGLNPDAVREHIESMIGPPQRIRPAHLPYSPEAKRVLERSPQEATLRGHKLVDPEHLLWAMTRDIRSAAVKTVTALGVKPARIRRQLQRGWDLR